MTVLAGTATPDTLPRVGSSPEPVVVRVLPDVGGLDKQFDYRLPAALLDARPSLDAFRGALVRVPLHGRRVVGWIVAVDPPQVVAPDRLHDIVAVVSHGPPPELLDLAEWASVRWAAGRLRPFLTTASPPRRVPTLPPPRRAAPVAVDGDDPVVAAYAELTAGAAHPAGTPTELSANRAVAATSADSSAGGPREPGARATIAVAPTTSPLGLITAFANDGPTLAVLPSVARAAAMAAALRRRGLVVALLPDEWGRAAAGVDVVIGARAAAWAPCPGLRAVVVVDEHDEALQEERTPTWHAREVLAERARRAGARLVLTSPAPSVASCRYEPRRSIRWEAMVAGWPTVEIVDRTDDEPWKSSLVTSRLIHFLRQPELRVVCVHNVPGRSRVLACRSCRELARCARCDAAVALADDGRFSCPRCGELRPQVCSACGGGAFANLKPGVTRLAEELAAAAGRAVASVTATGAAVATAASTRTTTTAATLPDVGIYVGTEAVLHRVAQADVVAFLDIDRELLAPRYRAREQTMTLLVRGARLLGPRRRGGRLLLQTYLPDDPLLRAVFRSDPLGATADELRRRETFRLPPASALASVTGEGADELIVALRAWQPLPPSGDRRELVGDRAATARLPGNSAAAASTPLPDAKVAHPLTAGVHGVVGGLTIGGGPDRYLVGADDWMELGAALVAAKQLSGTRPRIEVDPPRA